MPKAPFSFHCRICYERLNLTDRPPVVLPCGHTYICQQCSQRLTRCMECRTKIAPAAAVVPASTLALPSSSSSSGTPTSVMDLHHPNHHHHTNNQRGTSLYPRESYRAKQQRIFRQQQQSKYNTPGGGAVGGAGMTPEARKDAVLAGLQQPVAPPVIILPKNVVLMSLMEAAQPKHGVRHNDDDLEEAYESGDDDAQVLDGLAALGSACGTYVVKAKDGLNVYDGKPPNRMAAVAAATTVGNSFGSSTVATACSTTAGSSIMGMGGSNNNNTNHKLLTRSDSITSEDPPGKSPISKENNPPSAATNTSMKRSSSSSRRSTSNTRSRAMVESSHSSMGNLNGGGRQNTTGGRKRSNSLKQTLVPAAATEKEKPPIERLDYGDEIQVVCLVDDGTVAQLARGEGFVRIVNNAENGNDGDDDENNSLLAAQEEALVQVGEPTDEACRMEGIIHSIGEEKKQFKQRISELGRLEKTMQLGLRKFYKREAIEIQEMERKQREDELLQRGRSTGSHGSKGSKHNSSVVMELLEEDDIEIDVDLAFATNGVVVSTPPPSMPPTAMLGLGLASASSGTTSDGPDSPDRWASRQAQYRYDIAAAQHDDGIRESAPTSLHNRTRSDPLPVDPLDKPSDLTWEEELFNHGCDLFFCATMPLCAGSSAAASVASPHIQPTSSIVEGMIPFVHRNDSGRSKGEGDESTVGSSVAGGGGSGIDFATGMSGHRGVSRQQRRSTTTPYKKQVRMMSQHDGAAHYRRKKGSNSSVVSMGETTRASVATL